MAKPQQKPITTFEDLAAWQAQHALSNRKAIVVTGGSVHMVDKSNVDDLELGARVTDELR